VPTSLKTLLLFAATLWTLIGFGLLGFGLKWLLGSESEWIWFLVLAILIVGVGKGFLFLRKSALRTIKRMESRLDGSNILECFLLVHGSSLASSDNANAKPYQQV
jgi:hypothetical protein